MCKVGFELALVAFPSGLEVYAVTLLLKVLHLAEVDVALLVHEAAETRALTLVEHALKYSAQHLIT